MTGEWVSTGEAAEVLEVPMRELYRLIDRGEVPARRRGPVLEVYGRGSTGGGCGWCGRSRDR